MIRYAFKKHAELKVSPHHSGAYGLCLPERICHHPKGTRKSQKYKKKKNMANKIAKLLEKKEKTKQC